MELTRIWLERDHDTILAYPFLDLCSEIEMLLDFNFLIESN